jgi:hypothetical protein
LSRLRNARWRVVCSGAVGFCVGTGRARGIERVVKGRSRNIDRAVKKKTA